MSVRKTKVSWDPRYERLEYLDERGEPYYSEIQPCPDGGGAQAPEPATGTDEATGQTRALSGRQVATALLTGLLGFLRRGFS
jgi:hypothetical protein